MQKILVPIQIFFFLIVTAFLSSCTSSSYIERYKSTEKIEDNVYNNSTDNEVEEIDISEINTSSKEIIEKFTPLTGTNKKKKKFLYQLAKYIKIPYKYGGETKSGIDCSAFTQQVYKNSLNVNLPRTAREQYKIGEKIRKEAKLKFGDLVFFDTSKIYYPGHVGIFLGNKLFVHASSSKGVIVSSLENTYFSSRFIGAIRIKIKRKHN